MRMMPSLTVSDAICDARVHSVHLVLAICTIVICKRCKQNGHLSCKVLVMRRPLLSFPASCSQKQLDTLCKRHVVTRVQHLVSVC